ncbi:Regulator of G-protein signaling 3 [Paragonimus heterotremus]|uniref:Regulator of G-protein signaling 3 n=1 Tax=Paragonimus heterotremus TaxID=100268 RepID=A0A8J4TNT1_9TREM|nr:Regulator of G-protein signaling 3 [Paragonimus heterotremus]
MLIQLTPDHNVFTYVKNRPAADSSEEFPPRCSFALSPREHLTKKIPVDSNTKETSSTFTKRWKWLFKKYKNHRSKYSTKYSTVNLAPHDDNSKSLSDYAIHNMEATDAADNHPARSTSANSSVSKSHSELSKNSMVSEFSSKNATRCSREHVESPSEIESQEQPSSLLALSSTTRGKSISPEAQLFRLQNQRNRLQRGTSLGLFWNPAMSIKSGEINRTSMVSGSTMNMLEQDSKLLMDNEFSFQKRIPEKLTGKLSNERRKFSKLTNEMFDKFSVFHKSNSSSSWNHHATGGTSHGDNYRILLNKIFRSNWPTSEEVEQWSQSFAHILHDKCGILVFREFLRKEFSDENIEFWLTCEDFRNSVCSKKLQSRAQKIFNEFVAVQSKREVNLDSNTRLQLEKELDSVTKHTFDQSQRRIQALMEKDSYSRFLRSDLYSAVLEMSREQEQLRNSASTGHTNLDLRSWKFGGNANRESPIPGLLPSVTSIRKMANSSYQHTTGSLSAPSSPKQTKAEVAL